MSVCLLFCPKPKSNPLPSKTRRGCGKHEHLLSQQAHTSRKALAWVCPSDLSPGEEEGKRRRVSPPPKTQTPRLYFSPPKTKKGPPRAERAGVCFGIGEDRAEVRSGSNDGPLTNPTGRSRRVHARSTNARAVNAALSPETTNPRTPKHCRRNIKLVCGVQDESAPAASACWGSLPEWRGWTSYE
jgi:hypothetical protein